jgi:hypothetical protein
MKRTYVILTLIAIAILLGGCTKVVVPAGIPAINNAANNAPGTPPEQKKCDAAINYQILVDALPKDVNGYKADEPEGQMMSFTDPTTQNVMKYSTSSVNLEKDDKRIRINTMDTCYIQFLSMAWLGFYETEGTDGYLKRATVSGYPGWHQFDKSSNKYTYNLFVKERVLITVEGDDGVADADVEAAAKAIDMASIAAAAK